MAVCDFYLKPTTDLFIEGDIEEVLVHSVPKEIMAEKAGERLSFSGG
jgi:hypothetical protein